MIGAVQLGLLAGCVVVFVPMAMAGYHLSRNKMLFFSCALPSISSFLSQSEVIISSTPTALYRQDCIFFLHNVMYSDGRECEDDPFDDNNNNNGTVCGKSWDWIESGRVAECEFQKLEKSDVSVLLNGSWVVVAGDSQARLMAVSLLELVVGSESMEKMRGDLFKRHSDYSMVVDEIGMKLDFVWAPYVGNLTELISRLKKKKKKQNKSLPDVMVMGAGLWDMLHMNNVSEYGTSLRVLRDNVLALLPVSADLGSRLHLFWVGMPTLITSMLNTDEKREKMTVEMCDSYDHELSGSNLLRQLGGPLLQLDIRLLSDLCGPRCTADGMHYDGVVYDVAAQIMLNALLIDSNQKPQR